MTDRKRKSKTCMIEAASCRRKAKIEKALVALYSLVGIASDNGHFLVTVTYSNGSQVAVEWEVKTTAE